jgi:hypothetical protein
LAVLLSSVDEEIKFRDKLGFSFACDISSEVGERTGGKAECSLFLLSGENRDIASG